MTAKAIESFDGAWFFLSNFYESEVNLGNGVVVPTAEHAFQGLKTDDFEQAKEVLYALTPREAKYLGREVTLRPDWEEVKDKVMTYVIECKFASGSELAQRLLNTCDAELIEGNGWGDRYWGRHNGVGKNRLGEILMARRAVLAKEKDHG